MEKREGIWHISKLAYKNCTSIDATLPGWNFKFLVLKKPINIVMLLRTSRIEWDISLNSEAIRL